MKSAPSPSRAIPRENLGPTIERLAVRTNLSELSRQFTARHWRWLLVAMLLLLHFAAMRGVQDFWARGLMVAQFGLFILWQPFMQGQQRLSLTETLGVAVVAGAVLFYLNWWMLGLWVSVLAGLVGGKVFLFQARWLRIFYLLVLFYLVSLLLLWIVPNGFALGRLEREIVALVQLGLPVLFLLMLALPVESDIAEPQIVDFFYSTLLFLLLVVLVLGAFAFMTLGGANYGFALTYSLLTIAGVLLFLSLAWNPRAGFSGLSMFFSRYLLSIGLPFEQWLHFLADLSRAEARPDQFLKLACEGLGRLPWVTGGEWKTSADTGSFGLTSKNSIDFASPELRVRLYSRHRPSPSLVWHFNLLGQLLGQFYIGKQREMKLQQQTYVQALYETGARMTHDVKNLLQSLNILCSAAAQDSGDSPALQALIRRHLPTVTQRLQQTLDKLQKPQVESGRFVQASVWWDALQKIYQPRGVEFLAGTIEPTILLPKELFESAAENLLQNALDKRKLDPGLKVTAAFAARDTVVLEVCDSGRPVSQEVLHGLLRGPVPSETGYGIGLYQVARQAEMSGFSLRLAANEAGRVCFELSGTVRRPDRPAQ
jgi:signal transduction histidine kinase